MSRTLRSWCRKAQWTAQWRLWPWEWEAIRVVHSSVSSNPAEGRLVFCFVVWFLKINDSFLDFVTSSSLWLLVPDSLAYLLCRHQNTKGETGPLQLWSSAEAENAASCPWSCQPGEVPTLAPALFSDSRRLVAQWRRAGWLPEWLQVKASANSS